MGTDLQRRAVPKANGDDGYILLAVLVLVFLVLLSLTVAAPKIADQLKREREVETRHRAEQYVRAIRVFYRKTGHYPVSVEQLENTNNQRFLRQRYLDPMTGKDDWRLIAVGQNKTTVKGFFGEDLPGLGGPIGGSGLGGGATTGGSSSGSPFGGSSNGSSGGAFGSGNGAGGGSGSSFGSGSGSSFGSGSGFGSNGPGSGSNNNGGGSQNATDFKGSTGPFMGVGLPNTGESFLSVNGVSTYEEWEFLYDPRIEQLYAKGATLGGGISSGSGGGGASSFGGSGGSGFGSGGGAFGGAPGANPPAGGAPPTPPQP